MDKRDHARFYASNGFRVFPVLPGSKVPATREWPTRATTDLASIDEWWQENPDYNIGIATGNGVVAIDADVKDGKPGLQSLELMELELGVPAGMRTKTPSGGLHVLLKSDRPIRNRANTLAGYPGIDIRGDGGYVLGAGSFTDEGPRTVEGLYVLNGSRTLQAAPDAFYDMLAKHQAAHKPHTAAPITDLDDPLAVSKAISYLEGMAPSAIEGDGGDDTTFRVAARLRDYGLSESLALELMLDRWNETKAVPPWMPDELQVKVGNAYRFATGTWGGSNVHADFGIVEDPAEQPDFAVPADFDEGRRPSREEIARSSALPPAQQARLDAQRAKTPLPTIAASSFAHSIPPERDFLDSEQLLPNRNITILNGDGGTGKSLLAMQLAVAVASDAKWLGIDVKHGGVLYFSAEDDQDETHARLVEITAGLRVNLAGLERLHIAIMAGQDAVLAVEEPNGATMKATPLYSRLRATLAVTKPRLLVLDNLADIFGGNENVKTLVRQFVGMIRSLAIEFDCAVVILAHPSLTGISSGTGSSGNVAWNNSVRSRLYLKRQADKPEDITDPNFRKLVAVKSNYAATGREITMRWDKGRFTSLAAQMDDLGDFEREDVKSKSERVFVAMLRRFNIEKRMVSPHHGPNFAPAVFEKHGAAEGVTKRQFEQAMDGLLAKGAVAVDEIGPPSKRRTVLIVVDAEGSTDGLE